MAQTPDNQLPKIQGPMAVPMKQPYSVVQTGGGVSWGGYNINTKAIENYYAGMADLVKDGVKMWSDIKDLELEKAEWEMKKSRAWNAQKRATEAQLMSQGDLVYGGTWNPFPYLLPKKEEEDD